jgi:hypothetical protein
MSSPRAEPEEGKSGRRTRRPYEPWRKLALAGALILFVVSVLNAAIDGFPRPINMLSLGLGWGFLAAGFGRAMMDRRARERDTEPGTTRDV